MACSPSKNCAGTYGAATRRPFGRWPPATCLVTSFRNSSAKTMARYEDDQQTTLQTGGSHGPSMGEPETIQIQFVHTHAGPQPLTTNRQSEECGVVVLPPPCPRW